MRPSLTRREALALTAAGGLSGLAGLTGCRPDGATPPGELAGGWVGANAQRGHRLRELKSGALPLAAVQRRAAVLVVGAGVAGLAAARALGRAGVDDVHLLELEDVAGGNARGHVLAGMACPLGAHYLPTPGDAAGEVRELLGEFGLGREAQGRWTWDERHLCHSPQERLYFEGAWHDGLLPPAAPASATMVQYRRFAVLVEQAQRELGFSMPAARTPWTAGHTALESLTLAAWLQRQGLDDPTLRWYLDYCCRDDYGAGLDTVSAWAGLHYFASRHGFHAPGDGERDGERDGVLTWPEGNGWLTQRLAAPWSAERLHTGRTVLCVDEGRHEVQVLAWDESTGRAEAWTAAQVILAVPVFIAVRLLAAVPEALRQDAAQARHAPWLVANLHIGEPLLQRVGAPPAWDSVVYGAPSLGYVDAMHQSMRPHTGPTVLTAYWALLQAERAALLSDDWRGWARRVVADLAPLHPDLPAKLRRIDLMRYGHAMRIPLPGTRASAAHQALRELPGRVQLAHADLAGYSVFEEAYTLGWQAGQRVGGRLRPPPRPG